MILICYIFSTNKVLEIRLVVLIPLTTIPKFNWQLCLNLTNPNFAWFNSHSTKKVPTLGLASSYLRTPVLSVFYGNLSLTKLLNWTFGKLPLDRVIFLVKNLWFKNFRILNKVLEAKYVSSGNSYSSLSSTLVAAP